MVGFFIVMVFAFIAILAPLIAPYPRTFLAPDADRFRVNVFSQDLPKNLTYSGPVLGPTTPLNDAAGRMWVINYNRSRGLVFMHLLQYALGFNVSPFRAGANLSRTIDVTQAFNVTPIPGLPLWSVFYIVPGQDYYNHSTGPSALTGALAFFSGQDFVVADPFNQTLIFNYHLTFVPTWTGQDPASAGNMLIAPTQRAVARGPVAFPVGPYEYFYASNGNKTVVFEVTYVHAGYCQCDPASGKPLAFVNATLSARPFIYYNQFQVTAQDDYRSGPGQGIFLPLANGTLEVLSVTGRVRAWVPLTLNGVRATVAGDIGYVQAPYPATLFLPLRSSNAVGLAYLDLNTLQIRHEFALSSPSWEPLGMPLSRAGGAVYAAFYSGSNDTTFFVGLNATAGLNPDNFQVNMRGRARSYFYAEEPKQVFVFAANEKIFTLATTFSSRARITPDQFTVIPPSTVTEVRYAGAFGGTLYGSLLSTQELNGIFTDPVHARTTVFQLTGTPRTPLPPGTYESGNTYLLGTDYYGGDILTEWIYGTQVAFTVGILAALFSVGIGTLVGLVAGFYGKIVETLLMRTADVFLVLPFLAVVLVLVSISSPSIWIIIGVIAILGWPGISRVIRGQVLSLRERPFVDAARVSGASDIRLMFMHIAPNVLPFSFLYMSLAVGGAIITEAALSFLGFGDPRVTSWGGMLSSVLTFSGSLRAWWWLVPPGLGITFLSLGFYLIGRGFDEIINPRLRRR
jgi:peptide/nickel transport system permease protein